MKNIFLIALLFGSSLAFAQASFDDDVIDVAVPVDGGILTVLGGGLLYGLVKAKEEKR
jgi:hypothetical protein